MGKAAFYTPVIIFVSWEKDQKFRHCKTQIMQV